MAVKPAGRLNLTISELNFWSEIGCESNQSVTNEIKIFHASKDVTR